MTAIIHDILEDERKRLLDLIKRYEGQLADLPKGTIATKIRRGRWQIPLLSHPPKAG